MAHAIAAAIYCIIAATAAYCTYYGQQQQMAYLYQYLHDLFYVNIALYFVALTSLFIFSIIILWGFAFFTSGLSVCQVNVIHL